MQIQGMAYTQSNTVNSLNKTNKALKKILEKLSTARRINRASDDAAGLAVSEQLMTQVRGFKMASNNVSDAMSALNIGDGAANEITDLLQRNRELSLQAGNDTLTDSDRQSIDVEFQQNLKEIDRISKSVNFNTQDVIDGDGLGSGDAKIQDGPNSDDVSQLPSTDMTIDALGISDINVATSENAGTALESIDSAIAKINQSRATLGASYNAFESTLNNLNVAETNTTAAYSAITDQDMAMGIVELTKNKLLQESGMRAFSRFNDISSNHIMSLLQG